MAFNFSIIQTGQSMLDRIQANIKSALNQIVGQFIGGVFITSQSVGTSPTTLNHGLGKQPTIWVLGDINADAAVWRTAWTENSITLQASAPCVVSLWVNSA